MIWLKPRQWARLLHIQWVLIQYRLDEIILATHLFRPLRFIRFFLPWNWLPRKQVQAPAVRLRLAIEHLGPIFIKFGQALSTREDLLSAEVAIELAKLQDQVPPIITKNALHLIESAYDQPLSTWFKWVDKKPLACASIAQVHQAQLHDGRLVVIKLLRPGIAKLMHRDLALLHVLADLAERYWPESQRFHPKAVVYEYEKNLLDELDLMREAANANQLRRNFADSEMLYVPEVHWALTNRKVLVLEYVEGIPIGDITTLKARNVNLKRLGEVGVELFFTQVFRDSFFHADMHPGNIFVDATVPEKPRYIAIDFGIMGTLGPKDHQYLAQNFLAFFQRDYRRIAELYVESGWVPENTRVDEFESAIRTCCEPIYQRPLREISFGLFLVNMFQTARRFNMELQPQLVLLQKTLLNIEGLGRQLHPDLDLWQTAKPYMEKWMKERMAPKQIFDRLSHQIPGWISELPEVPLALQRLVHHASRGQVRAMIPPHQLEQILALRRREQRGQFFALLGGSLLVAGVLIATPVYHWQQVSLVSWLLILGSGVAFKMAWSSR